MPRRVVVGVDGSTASNRAASWAAGLVAETGGEVVVVHAAGLLARQTATVGSSSWCEPFEVAGVPYRWVVAEGNPVLALLHVAADVAADLVVVGKRGSGGFPGLQLGSTSQELVAHSPVAVVVVPAS